MAKVEITAQDILEALGFNVEVFTDQEVEVDHPKLGKYTEYKNFVQITHQEFDDTTIEFDDYRCSAVDACKNFLIDKLFKMEK